MGRFPGISISIFGLTFALKAFHSGPSQILQILCCGQRLFTFLAMFEKIKI